MSDENPGVVPIRTTGPVALTNPYPERLLALHHRTLATATALIAAAMMLACGEKPAPAAGRQVRDDLGRSVTVAPRIDSAVTLAPNLTEIVYAIGAEAKLAGTDSFSDEPAAAKALPKVGGLNPSIEKIATLRPDVVLATTNGNPPSLEPALSSANLPLFVIRTDRVDDIPRAIRSIGTLLQNDRTASVADRVGAEIEAQRKTRNRAPRVLFVVWADPLYVGGTGTFADDLLRLTGATNAVSINGWPQLSLENLAAATPDILLYPDRSVPPAQIDALVKRIPELKRSKIVPVDENLFTRPGPRVGQAAAGLNRILDAWESETQ